MYTFRKFVRNHPEGFASVIVKDVDGVYDRVVHYAVFRSFCEARNNSFIVHSLMFKVMAANTIQEIERIAA